MDEAETTTKQPLPFLTLRRFNNALSILIVILAVYIFVGPFIQQIVWWVERKAPVISNPLPSVLPKLSSVTLPQQNTLFIPSLGMQEQIYEGKGIETVNKGVWRRPNTSTPPEQSNTVLVGHRFTYAGHSVFYNLDKVNVGDELGIYWQGKMYTYKVNAIKVVEPTEISVESPSDSPKLTLYTCTPLWSAKQRLVIEADLISESKI